MNYIVKRTFSISFDTHLGTYYYEADNAQTLEAFLAEVTKAGQIGGFIAEGSTVADHDYELDVMDDY